VTRWNVLTGEYPPDQGGVADYSQLVAHGLLLAGDEVHIWTQGRVRLDLERRGITVHRLPGHFGPQTLVTLRRDLRMNARLLVQYVPHAFGAKAMNVLFCAWLFAHRNQISIDVMFHEVAFPVRYGQPARRNFLGLVTRMMAMLVARAATRVFVTTSAWEPVLRTLGVRRMPIVCLPVPSNVPVVHDPECIRMARSRYADGVSSLLGHFGTYNEWIANALEALLPSLLKTNDDVSILLLGRGGDEMRNRLVRANCVFARRIAAPGALALADLSCHLSACDLMIQPYPDGITTRRTSAMAVLSHGRAMVTTSGHLTESLWAETRAVAMARVGDVEQFRQLTACLLRNDGSGNRLGHGARELYQTRFSLDHTITALRHESAPSRIL
jgi:glycosyltransferase involved in cell wall biosynthesis